MLFCIHSFLEKPEVQQKLQNIIAQVGADVEFQCKISGHSNPVIVWRKKEGRIPSDRAYVLNSNLRISNVKVSDEGEYVCEGGNLAGTAETSATLVIRPQQPQLYFVTEPRNQTVRVGSKVYLVCKIVGYPPPIQFWTRNQLDRVNN